MVKLIMIVVIFCIMIIYAWPQITSRLTYQDWDLIVRLLTGLAPFIVVYFTFWSWIKNREYKNDYHKKILDKRIEAYEKLNELLFSLDQVHTILDQEGDSKVHACFVEGINFKNAINNVEKCVESNVWLSPDTNKKLSSINNFLRIVDDYVEKRNTLMFINLKLLDEEKYRQDFEKSGKRLDVILQALKKTNRKIDSFIREENKDAIQVGMTFYSYLSGMIYDLRHNIYSDLQNLDRIDEFLKDGERNTQ